MAEQKKQKEESDAKAEAQKKVDEERKNLSPADKAIEEAKDAAKAKEAEGKK